MPAIASFVALVRENIAPGMIVVEVGVWRGDTAMAWLPVIREVEGRGILIDHFKGNVGLPAGVDCAWDPGQADSRRDKLVDRLVEAGLGDSVDICQASSRRAARELPDASCDLIFIDADHRYSAVREDVALYLPKVKPGGILCGHDVHSLVDAGELSPESLEVDYWNGRHCGVDRAVWEAFGVDGVELRPGNLWVRRIETSPGV